MWIQAASKMLWQLFTSAFILSSAIRASSSSAAAAASASSASWISFFAAISAMRA